MRTRLLLAAMIAISLSNSLSQREKACHLCHSSFLTTTSTYLLDNFHAIRTLFWRKIFFFPCELRYCAMLYSTVQKMKQRNVPFTYCYSPSSGKVETFIVL